MRVLPSGDKASTMAGILGSRRDEYATHALHTLHTLLGRKHPGEGRFACR